MRKFQAGQRVIFGKDRRPGQAFTCEDLKSGLPFRPDPGQRVLQADDQRLQSRVRRQNVRPRAEQIRRYPFCRVLGKAISAAGPPVRNEVWRLSGSCVRRSRPAQVRAMFCS